MKERGPISHSEIEDLSSDEFIIISKISDIESVESPELVRSVHISKQAGTSLKAVEKLIHTFENLESVTANPSSYERLQGKEQWWVLKDREISVREQRMRGQTSYDITPSTQAMKDKKVLYNSIFEENEKPEVAHKLYQMDAYGIIRLDLIHSYLGGELKTIDDVAKEAGVNRNTAGNEIVIVLSIMGYPYSEHTQELAKMRMSHYERARKQREKQERLISEKRKFRDGFSVIDGESVVSPPFSLNAKKLKKWKILQEVIVEDKDRWKQFCEDEPRVSSILKQYFQLGEYRDKPISSKEIGKIHGKITIAGVNYLVNQGLRQLSGKNS